MSNYWRSLYTIWYRDILRFWRNKIRALGSFTFPILWLLVFGNGIGASLSLPIPGVSFIDFLFPGIIAQFLIFTAMFSAVSILQDREFGFLKEVLVSPAPRSAITLGKILGGATTAFISALPILILGPVAGVHYTWEMVLLLLPAMALLAITLSTIGVAIVSRMKSLDSGQYVFQFIMFPLTMLSGAFFPLRNLPGWLNFLTKINPLSYAVDILRRIVFEYSNLPSAAVTALSPTINGAVVPVYQEVTLVLEITVILILLASYAFKSE